MVTARMSESLV